MGPDNIKYNSDGDVLMGGIKINEMSINQKSKAFSYAVQCFIDDFGKNIPNLLNIGLDRTISSEHWGCSERATDAWNEEKEIGAVRMFANGFNGNISIEGFPLGEYSQEEQDSLFDYIIDSLKRNDFNNTLLILLQQADSEAVEDPIDGIYYNPHEIRN